MLKAIAWLKIIACVIILFVSLMLGIAIVYPQQTIRPLYPDNKPCDGLNDAGSFANPYIIRDEYGRETGRIRARYPDSNPHDGLNDWSNPWEIEK